jgi:hypothetical protein
LFEQALRNRFKRLLSASDQLQAINFILEMQIKSNPNMFALFNYNLFEPTCFFSSFTLFSSIYAICNKSSTSQLATI